jgi:hypothetical protein
MIMSDLRYAFRQLVRRPAHFLLVIQQFELGDGALGKRIGRCAHQKSRQWMLCVMSDLLRMTFASAGQTNVYFS